MKLARKPKRKTAAINRTSPTRTVRDVFMSEIVSGLPVAVNLLISAAVSMPSVVVEVTLKTLDVPRKA
ncbi:hypothetical protein D3C72_1754730 [compost metagenome]